MARQREPNDILLSRGRDEFTFDDARAASRWPSSRPPPSWHGSSTRVWSTNSREVIAQSGHQVRGAHHG